MNFKEFLKKHKIKHKDLAKAFETPILSTSITKHLNLCVKKNTNPNPAYFMTVLRFLKERREKEQEATERKYRLIARELLALRMSKPRKKEMFRVSEERFCKDAFFNNIEE